MTATSLADRIRLERRSGFVGRETELARLAGVFEERGAVMTLVVHRRKRRIHYCQAHGDG